MAKMEPISIFERGRIIRHLAKHGTWEGVRRGAHIRLFRLDTQERNRIEYAVGIGSQSTVGRTLTVAEAIDEANSLIVHTRSGIRFARLNRPSLEAAIGRGLTL
jgi:hypothetical protein